MIFVTVGTQLPFDRLIRVIDEIAPGLDTPVLAQTGSGTYRPKNIEWSELIAPIKFDETIRKTSLIVSHAGIGTVLTAQKYRKPVVLMPRLAAQGEHRNDHQVATANALRGRSGIYIADTEGELAPLLGMELEPPRTDGESPLRKRLRDAISQFIASR